MVGRHYRVRELLRTLSCPGTGPCSTVYLVGLPHGLPSSITTSESRGHRLRLKRYGRSDLQLSRRVGFKFGFSCALTCLFLFLLPLYVLGY